MADGLARLRAACVPAHRALESDGVFARILAPDVGLADYRCLLHTWQGFLSGAEPALRAALTRQGLMPAYLARMPRLEADLAALGWTRLAPSPAPPVIDSRGRALGLLYVLEGSALGGRVIARHLARTLGPAVAGAMQFLSATPESGLHWRACCALLDGALDTPLAVEEATEVALWAFATLRQVGSSTIAGNVRYASQATV